MTAPDVRPSLATSRAWWIATLMVLMLATVAMRAAVNFGSELPPSMDAAYYPAQTRWLMERGRLMYNDLPVYFRIQAGLTRGLMSARGMAIDDAALLASRTIDSLTGALLAVPIVLLGRRWAGGRAAGRWGAIAVGTAAMLAVLSLPAYRMVSDFQKNTLGLVWMAAAVWAVHGALSAGERGKAMRWWAATGAFVLLAALTHVGAAGATVLVIGLCVATDVAVRRRMSPRTLLLGAAGAVALGGVAFGGLYLAEPSRAAKVLRAPAELFSTSTDRGPRDGPGSGPGASGRPGPLDRDGRPIRQRPGDGPDGAAGPDRMRDGSRGPGGNPAAGPGFPGGWPERGTPLLAYAAALAAMLKLSVDRRSLTAADRAVVLACAITAMALACPLISGEYRQRLLLMSPVPAAIACAFVLARLSINTTGGRAWRTAVPSAIVGMLCLVSLAHGFRTPHPPILTPESLAELKELRGEIDDPARTLVVARHGLEWWAAHALNTPVRMGRVPEDAFEKYERVLIVQDVRPPMGPRREGRGGGPGGFGPPPMGDAGPDDGGDAGGMPRLPAGADWGPDDDVRMPPPRRMRDPDGGPGPRRGPLGGRGPGPGGGGPGGPGMMSIRVPPGSRLIHEGEWYRVFEVPRTSAE